MGWQEFVTDHSISYIKGTKKSGGNIQIMCPFCEKQDGKHKLGLHLKSSRWGCWRDKRHSGRLPYDLIAKLMHTSTDAAKEVARRYFSNTELYSTSSQGAGFDLSLTPKGVFKDKRIEPPSEFYHFKNYDQDIMNQLQKPFIEYLQLRDIDPAYAIPRFALRWCVLGKYAHRLIIPIMDNKEWYTFTGRAVYAKETLRYMTGETDASISDFLFNQDAMKIKNRILLVLEGPFDAMKAASCFIPGLTAVALMTKSISPAQLSTICKYQHNFDAVAIGFDADALADSLKNVAELSWYLPNVFNFQTSAKDLGSMSIDEATRELHRLVDAANVIKEFKRNE